MGIQIYITKEALTSRDIPIINMREETYDFDDHKYTETLCEVHGLNLQMTVFGETIYHDANRWGSSRIALLAFIEKHGLLAGSDWYEG